MVLEVGKGGKTRFIRFIKKTNIFECGSHGLVLERENNLITLYVTNNRCSEIYARAALGGNEILKKGPLVVAAYSENIMLVDGGDLLIVVDFAEKKVAVNQSWIEVIGKKDWEGDVQMPWKPGFDAMFGLETPSREMDHQAAKDFWKWFLYCETEIIEKISAGGDAAQSMMGRVREKLSPVFPYEYAKNVEFQLACNADGNVFVMYHFNEEKLMQDADILGELMPDALVENWTYITEA